MRRKIKHSKRYKDYPKNVPRKLLKLFFSLDCSVSKLAKNRGVNSGYVSALLNDGNEPIANEVRTKLFLNSSSVCRTCGRKIIRKKAAIKRETPEHIKRWKHLSTDERNRVIKEYLKWKNSLPNTVKKSDRL